MSSNVEGQDHEAKLENSRVAVDASDVFILEKTLLLLLKPLLAALARA